MFIRPRRRANSGTIFPCSDKFPRELKPDWSENVRIENLIYPRGRPNKSSMRRFRYCVSPRDLKAGDRRGRGGEE